MKNIYLPDWMIILSEINKGRNNLLDLQLVTKITYSHLHGIHKIFIKQKWITVKKVGGRNVLTLTKLGKQISNIIMDLCININIQYEDIIYFRRVNK